MGGLLLNQLDGSAGNQVSAGHGGLGVNGGGGNDLNTGEYFRWIWAASPQLLLFPSVAFPVVRHSSTTPMIKRASHRAGCTDRGAGKPAEHHLRAAHQLPCRQFQPQALRREWRSF